MTDPLSIIKQITNLLFIRSLDSQQELKEKQANNLKMEIHDPIYPDEFFRKQFRDHFNNGMFSGFENDTTMIGKN